MRSWSVLAARRPRERRTGAAALALAGVVVAGAPGPAPAGPNFLELVEVELDDVGGAEGLASARGVAVSPDGAHVYAASRGDNTLSVFERDAGSGALAFLEAHVDGVAGVDGLAGAHSVMVSPDGAHVYVAAVGESEVAAFARAPTTGTLTFVDAYGNGAGGADGLGGARAIAASPDGAHVYVAGQTDDAVVVFARDAASGALAFVEAEVNGEGGVSGLNGPSAVAVSADGAHVYVASQNSNAVVAFARAPASGVLSFAQALFDFDGGVGVEGLHNARGVAVSPDGAHVYVASQGDDAVVAFARDASTGRLTHVETEVDDGEVNEGLGGAREVAVSPDGRYVFVAGARDDAVIAFERDIATGELSVVDFEIDDEAGIDGLAGARGLAMSPEGASVYVASQSENAIAVFRFIACAAAPLSACRGAEKTSLVLLDSKDDLRDRLRFQLQRGDEVLDAALGDPIEGLTSYNLCLYDRLFGVSQTVMGVLAPLRGVCDGEPCWRKVGGNRTKLRYKDPELTPDGLERVVVKTGARGRSLARLEGEGLDLKFESAVPLPLIPPVTIQLVNSLGECWGVVYEEEDIRRNDGPIRGPQRFKARASGADR